MEGWYDQKEAGGREISRLTKVYSILIYIDAQEVFLTYEGIVQLNEHVTIVIVRILKDLEELFLEEAISIGDTLAIQMGRIVSFFRF